MGTGVEVGLGVRVGTGVGLGRGVYVGAVVAVDVGNGRVGVGVSGTEEWGGTVLAPLPLTSAGECTVVAGGLGADAQGASIDSVNIASPYPAPTAASKMSARMEIVRNLVKTEWLERKPCSRCAE